MTDQLISTETAKLAKDKVDWDFMCHPADIAQCVTQSLLQKWLREKRKIIVSPFIAWNLITWGYNIHFIDSKDVTEKAKRRIYHGADCHNYEEALEAGLQEALKLIEI